METVRSAALPNVLKLCASPVLQGIALKSLLEVLQGLVAVGSDGLTFGDLLGALTGLIDESLPRSAIANLAKCTAELCAHAPAASRDTQVTQLVSKMQSSEGRARQHALLCVGELGEKSDLSAVPNVQGIILGAFESPDEETKSCAAYALGRSAVGDMGARLGPVCTEQIGSYYVP